MSEKPVGYSTMQEEPGAGVPPPYGPPQPGYPPPQAGYQQPQQGYSQPVVTQPSGFQSTNTTVVVNQPAPVILMQGQRDWSTGLCGCFEDCYSLCMGLCCPCFLLVDISSRMDEGCCFACCCPGALLGLRIKLRVQENIQGSLMNDYCAVQCCTLCVLCQLSRELNRVARI